MKLEVKFTSDDYMACVNMDRFCIKCGIPMVEWFDHGSIPTGEYFCGMCGLCVHPDNSIHQLPKNNFSMKEQA